MLFPYRIIDARYCYEYQGGHIRSAENFGTWDEEAFMNEFLPENLAPRQFIQGKDYVKPNILIFHCEFSSARGPTLMRFLRNRYYLYLFFKNIFFREINVAFIMNAN